MSLLAEKKKKKDEQEMASGPETSLCHLPCIVWVMLFLEEGYTDPAKTLRETAVAF